MKKYLSIILVIVMLFHSITVSAVDINNSSMLTDNDSTLHIETPVSKDLTSEVIYYLPFEFVPSAEGIRSEVTPCFFPDLQNMASPFGIIGDDNRHRVADTEIAPYSAVCCIEVKFPGDPNVFSTTAWMIGPDIAITAAHNIYQPNFGGWVDSVEIIPGKDGNGWFDSPYGSCDVVSVHTSMECLEDIIIYGMEYTFDSARPLNDWAILVLEDSLGEETGWFGFGWTNRYFSGTTVTITGYPEDTENTSYLGHQYTMTDLITSTTETALIYNAIDVSGGQSGSPIYTSDYVSYGIHSGGSSFRNIGSRITEWRYQYFKSFLD